MLSVSLNKNISLSLSVPSGGMQGLQNMMRQFQQGAAGKMPNMFQWWKQQPVWSHCKHAVRKWITLVMQYLLKNNNTWKFDGQSYFTMGEKTSYLTLISWGKEKP